LDLVQGRARIDHPEMDDDADPDGHLVGREDLLALDRQLALADVDQDDLHLRGPGEAQVDVPRDDVSPGAPRLRDHAILVIEPAVRVLDDDFVPGHGATSAPPPRRLRKQRSVLGPRSEADVQDVRTEYPNEPRSQRGLESNQRGPPATCSAGAEL